jgi:hypothetical protein
LFLSSSIYFKTIDLVLRKCGLKAPPKFHLRQGELIRISGFFEAIMSYQLIRPKK